MKLRQAIFDVLWYLVSGVKKKHLASPASPRNPWSWEPTAERRRQLKWAFENARPGQVVEISQKELDWMDRSRIQYTYVRKADTESKDGIRVSRLAQDSPTQQAGSGDNGEDGRD